MHQAAGGLLEACRVAATGAQSTSVLPSFPVESGAETAGVTTLNVVPVTTQGAPAPDQKGIRDLGKDRHRQSGGSRVGTKLAPTDRTGWKERELQWGSRWGDGGS